MKDASGEVQEVHCTYDPKTKGGWSDDGRKVKGTLHWVSAQHAVDAEVRLFEPLLLDDEENSDKDFLETVNPDSLISKTVKIEPALKSEEPGKHFQFLRTGYYCSDSKDHSSESPVFNRIVGLRDTWAKVQKKGS